ncbi:hypothetical protein [Pedobacter rhizosphaerae]|uniref:Lipoprotein n=1 Tax=Pedobacter rhizosphaerae TaxID=390241 RepID=A0A1H9RQ15_9SPHI|nr:hypothetical protein [Pedobacter rhizosphaerae]SER75061.1 hypothetical protein SAMN04488023_11581 [Pedobacter rhizosphaerae]
MRKIGILIISTFLLVAGCREKSIIHPTFYYWKTIYQDKKVETDYLNRFKSPALYVRIMDVDIDPNTLEPAPVSPITFQDPIPAKTTIIPVVYLVNNLFNTIDSTKSNVLANHIAKFVDAKVKQAGKNNYSELQIDCDWTKTTRDSYFTFLRQLQDQPLLKSKLISVTLRLHQVKNIVSSGIPPVKKAILMCYNMGNLRKYGEQNSILDLKEMDTYLKKYLENYPLKLDVALPIFEWAVIFRNKAYAGISKRLNKQQILDPRMFKRRGSSILFDLLVNLPQAGLKKGDVVRWEEITADDLLATSKFLSRYLKPDDRNLVFYHLDTDLLKHYTHDDFQKVIANF